MLVCRVESQSDSEFTKSISSTVGLVVLRVTVIKRYYCPTIPARWKLQKKNIYQWIPVLKPPFVLDDSVIKHKQPLSVDSAIVHDASSQITSMEVSVGMTCVSRSVPLWAQAQAFLMCNTGVALSIPAVRHRLGASNLVPRYCHHAYFVLFYRNQGCFHRRPAKTPRSASDLVW